jgi:excisionase family DNA binding protein
MLEFPAFSTVNEVAARTRLSRASVHRAIRLGRLRALRPDGVRRLLIPSDALQEFLQPSPRALRGRDECPPAEEPRSHST